MAQFIDNTESLVTRALDALLATQALTRLDGYPDIKVVHRQHLDTSRVALISGGGSGHEPAHTGFVGRGMLTAAVSGEVFSSPSVDAVLAGILAVTGDAGCLLIVKNYTGDRLNFGLAAERAKAMGKRVEMVVVGDDIALPDLPQPRGVAGTLFVHKIAGYLAEQGESLEVVAASARRVASALRSYGVALNSCTLPGSDKDDRIPEGMAEMGLGIHGEHGVETVEFVNATATCKSLMDTLFEGQPQGQGHVLLLNNLGGTTALEMNGVLSTLLSTDHAHRINYVVGPAPLMTALDMHGLSVSILPAEPEWVQALEAPVDTAAWPGCRALRPISVAPVPEGMQGAPAVPSHDADRAALLRHGCEAFIAMHDDLNELDAQTGDGDTGSTLAHAARSLQEHLDELPLQDTPALFGAISSRLAVSMGGSSGVLMAILFSAASDAMRSGQSAAEALRSGASRMMDYGGARVGDRTLLDALVPALDALVSGGSLSEAAAAAREGAHNTQSITQARAGRSVYVPESSLNGVPDPGAEAVARCFEVLAARSLEPD